MNEEPHGRIKGRIWWILINSLWLLPLAYAFKCILTLSGRCLGPRLDGRRSAARRTLGDLHSVEGEAAVWAGLGYVALAVFVYSYVYVKPDPDGWWGWRVLRIPLWCGSLVAVVWFWYKALHV